MKRVAYVALHYGAEYLAWAIRAAQRCVDEIHVFYSPRPTFGYASALACPESESDLMREAQRFRDPNVPLHWHHGDWKAEGQHRDGAVAWAKEAGAKTILVLDADEVWDRSTLEDQLCQAEASQARDTLVPFVHFWRSFRYVCSDPSRPVRIINLRGEGLRYADQKIPVLHFGYAQSEALTRYKISIHGHKGEWRQDWLDGKFLSWRPGDLTKDVHPTCGWNSSFNDYFWNVRPTDEALKPALALWLGDHPYRDLEIIR